MMKSYITTSFPKFIPRSRCVGMPAYIQRIAVLSQQEGRTLVQFFTESRGYFFPENQVLVSTKSAREFIRMLPGVWVKE